MDNAEIRTIHQIVPAHPGWSEVSKYPPDESLPEVRPVVVWALLEDHSGQRFVTGLTAGSTGDGYALLPPDSLFDHYVFEGE